MRTTVANTHPNREFGGGASDNYVPCYSPT